MFLSGRMEIAYSDDERLTMARSPKAPAVQSAKDQRTLDQRMHVRHRVGMYLSDAASNGMSTGLREIIDNAGDEARLGFGNEIIVTFHQDGSAEVQDFGRGLPVDDDEKGVNGIIKTVGTIGSGGKFMGESATGGLNGVGASATIATSERADVRVYQGGKEYTLSFKEGLPGFFAVPNDPNSKFTSAKKPKVAKDTRSAAERKKHPSGTTIRFWPDFTVFVPGSVFLVDDLKFRLRSIAFLLPGLKFRVVDARESEENPVVEEYEFDGGLKDMVPTLTHQELVVPPVALEANGSFSEIRNVLQSDNSTKRAEVERNVEMTVAFGYVNDESTTLKSYVNTINTNNGGTHEQGLWRAMSRVLIGHIKNTKGFLKAKEEAPVLEDVRDGFVGVISVNFPEPVFTGQEKSALGSTQIVSVVSQGVGEALSQWIKNKKNAKAVRDVCNRIVEASRVRIAARAQKDLARKKSALETSASMPPKLVECEFTGDSRSELMLVEGDSALGTLRKARDARYQALFPLRGKVLNVIKASTSTMLANAECAAMIQVMGAGSGKSFDLADVRYSKIIIETDADVDGAHIKSLLITFFWKYMRPFVEDGRVYAALPPLFEVKFNEGQRNEETVYALDRKELDAVLKKHKNRKYKISRNKGLGEMTMEGAEETLMNPETRVLKQIRMEDVENAGRILELAMGPNVQPRKEWISVSRDKVSDDDVEM